jgi:succinoglycan exporter
MKMHLWSMLLQYSRAGVTAAVFLIAARFLTLEEIGAFAIAFAPVRIAQSVHKAGIVEMVVIGSTRAHRLNALFSISISAALLLSATLLVIACLTGDPHLATLSVLPLVHGASAVSEGLLRRALLLRDLALRTLFTQACAAFLCLMALAAGWTTGALVLFVLSNGVLTGLLSLRLAGWRPRGGHNPAYQSLLLRKCAQIAGRDLIGSGTLPVAQLIIGAIFGLTASGAFQIAVRCLAMLEALTLAPLRYLALPVLARDRAELANAVEAHLTRASLIAGWVWFGALAAAPQSLNLLMGSENAAGTAPFLIALLPLGLCAAISMPFTQALTALGHTGLVLRRAVLTTCLSLGLLICAMFLPAPLAAASLSAGSILSLVWYLPRACTALGLLARSIAPIWPPILAGSGMALVLFFLPLGLGPRILVGTAIYALLIGALQMRDLRRSPA